jgi:hypothetical protein
MVKESDAKEEKEAVKKPEDESTEVVEKEKKLKEGEPKTKPSEEPPKIRPRKGSDPTHDNEEYLAKIEEGILN